jgi:hypothetical protein
VLAAFNRRVQNVYRRFNRHSDEFLLESRVN